MFPGFGCLPLLLSLHVGLTCLIHCMAMFLSPLFTGFRFELRGWEDVLSFSKVTTSGILTRRAGLSLPHLWDQWESTVCGWCPLMIGTWNNQKCNVHFKWIDPKITGSYQGVLSAQCRKNRHHINIPTCIHHNVWYLTLNRTPEVRRLQKCIMWFQNFLFLNAKWVGFTSQ